MTLMRMSHHSLHCVIRAAAIAVQDPGFQLLQFFNMFPAQVLSRVHTYEYSRESSICTTSARFGYGEALLRCKVEVPLLKTYTRRSYKNG